MIGHKCMLSFHEQSIQMHIKTRRRLEVNFSLELNENGSSSADNSLLLFHCVSLVYCVIMQLANWQILACMNLTSFQIKISLKFIWEIDKAISYKYLFMATAFYQWDFQFASNQCLLSLIDYISLILRTLNVILLILRSVKFHCIIPHIHQIWTKTLLWFENFTMQIRTFQNKTSNTSCLLRDIIYFY